MDRISAHHAEWLSLVELSGPFLTLPVLERALPQGLTPVDTTTVRRLRLALEEFQEDPELLDDWVEWVLRDLLSFDDESLLRSTDLPDSLTHEEPEYGITLRPDWVIREPRGDESDVQARLVVNVWPSEQDLDTPVKESAWAASPIERMVELARECDIRLSLVTNGRRFVLVDAPQQQPVGVVTFDPDLWLEERRTLDAFRELLGVERFFAVEERDTLEALLAESANAQQEVTETLGAQVRAAVELLVDAFSRADRDTGGRLLAGVEPMELYRAAVGVMMRLVFLLSAEERGMFPLGDELYDTAYAVSTLRGQLQEEADGTGEAPLGLRTSAWHRILATFRLVHEGVQHEQLRLPAYGGGLFDPDQYPFLEGRLAGEMLGPGVEPMPVDDRTILHVLDALQVLRRKGRRGGDAQRLSYRALDVEQIGHVYEGLLDHTAIRVTDPAVALRGKKEPELALASLKESWETLDWDDFYDKIADESGLTVKQVAAAVDIEVDATQRGRLLAACDNDGTLAERITPFVGLLREDLREYPMVFLPGSVYVTKTLERRSSGTYYTPRSLAEEVVRYTLEPLVHHPGPADGANPKDWRVRPISELLELRVCDMAMGSGAFLVAACRYLAERVLEAWKRDGDDAVIDAARGDGHMTASAMLPSDPGDRELYARRLVADRCLYGVDKDAMAVEMAKLSLWLVTLAKGRPFSFLDHALRCGDSLLGSTDVRQLINLHPDPERGAELHGAKLFDDASVGIRRALDIATERRRQLESFTVLDVRDADEKQRLLEEAEDATVALRTVADVVMGAAMSTATQAADALDDWLAEIAPRVAPLFDNTLDAGERGLVLMELAERATTWLAAGRPRTASAREPLHWPLEFPEVLARGGFDAVIGNPPFLGGKRISSAHGRDYEAALKLLLGEKRGAADLSAHFLRRAFALIRGAGVLGLLTTDRISQGDTRRLGLDAILASGGTVYRARPKSPWPGDAATWIAMCHVLKGDWAGEFSIDGQSVTAIGSDLRSTDEGLTVELVQLDLPFVASLGTYVLGEGFVVDPSDPWIKTLSPPEKKRLRPYLSAQDLMTDVGREATRLVIDLSDVRAERVVEEEYPRLYSRLCDTVRPVRASLTGQIHQEDFWRFWDLRPRLYSALAQFRQAIVCPRLTRVTGFALVSTDQVFTDQVVVIAAEDSGLLGVLQSQIHWAWLEVNKTDRGTGTTYVVSRCLRTFPLPSRSRRVDAATEEYLTARSAFRMPLTTIFNAVDNPGESKNAALRLRDAIVALDHAVCDAYGWSDLHLAHGFYETSVGCHFTLSRDSRQQVIRRLAALNKQTSQETPTPVRRRSRERSSSELPLGT